MRSTQSAAPSNAVSSMRERAESSSRSVMMVAPMWAFSFGQERSMAAATVRISDRADSSVTPGRSLARTRR